MTAVRIGEEQNTFSGNIWSGNSDQTGHADRLKQFIVKNRFCPVPNTIRTVTDRLAPRVRRIAHIDHYSSVPQLHNYRFIGASQFGGVVCDYFTAFARGALMVALGGGDACRPVAPSANEFIRIAQPEPSK